MIEIPKCPLCKNQNNEKCFSIKNYDVFVCHVCELFFINPYPINSQVHNKILDYNYNEIKILEPIKHYYAEVHYYKKYFSLITSECKNVSSVLDIGCGTGHLLELLKRKYPNLNCIGIELNTDRAKMARKVSSCEIHQIPVEKFSSKENFDVIIMINVLSHIPSFDKLFNTINSLLKENGKLMLKVGEMKKNVKKKAIFGWGIPDHLHFLGLNTINFLCNKYNFKIYKHHRISYSDELFSKNKWKTLGRSNIRNLIKKIIIFIPFALPTLAKSYDLIFGKEIYSSFIILSNSKKNSRN